MLLEDHIFQGVVQTAIAVLYTSLFGMGILVCLAKISRYNGMIVGAFGCLGFLVLRAAEYLAWMPQSALSTTTNLGPTLVQGREHVLTAYAKLEPWHGLEIVHFAFFACLVLALAGRLRAEGDAATEKIDQMMGEPI